MNALPLLIAWRYLMRTVHAQSISSMIAVCFVGIALGTFSLAVVACVMNGFEKETHRKLQGLHPHIIMEAGGRQLNFSKISSVLQKEFPSIAAFSPYDTQHVVAHHEGEHTSVLIQGVDPATITDVSVLATKISAASDTMPELIAGQHIIIGTKCAQSLGVNVGDTVTLLFADEENIAHHKVTLESTEATVSALLNTGVSAFDKKLIMCSLPFLHSLFPEAGVTEIGIKPMDESSTDEIIKKLRERFDLQVYSWQELYPDIVAALKLEKYAMFLILALITLVASLNLVSLLFMHIRQKRGDIAILRAMGMPATQINTIFITMSLLVTGLATVVGLTLAYGTVWLLNTYSFIKLPDVYYVSHLPAEMDWRIFALVLGVALCLGLVATWIPLRSTRLNIADVLRFEA